MLLESEITFRSTNLSDRCFKSFADFKTQKKFCDVAFTVGTHHISAHRIIVAAAIPLFQDAFVTEDCEITIPDVDPDVFECLIDFAYSCELKISLENVRALLSGACKLHMDEVRDACCDFLAERLTPENVLNIRELADELHYPVLTEVTDHYIKERFVAVCESEEILKCPQIYLMELIGKDDLCVDSEERVLDTVLRWVRASSGNRKPSLPGLLRLVRMPLIAPLLLTDVQETEEVIRTSFESRDLIDEAKNYNLFPQRRKSTCSFSTKPRHSAAAVNVNRQEDNGFIFTLTAQTKYIAHHFDLEANEWLPKQSQSFVVTTGSTAELNGKMYFCRWGYALRYDPSINEFKYMAHLTVPRITPGAASLKNKIYVCGGRVGKRNASSVVECFDPETDEWTKVSQMRTARWGLQAVSVGEYIYTLGGRDSSSVFDTVERYPSVTGEWTTMPSMLVKRGSPGAAALNGKIYVCGGYTLSTGTECCVTAEVYDPIKNKWEFISPMNTARCEANLVSCRGKLYAFGGKNANNELRYSIEVYEPGNDKWISGPTGNFDNFVSAVVSLNRA